MNKATSEETDQLVKLIRQYYRTLRRRSKGLPALVAPAVFLAGLALAGIFETHLYLSAVVKSGIGILLAAIACGSFIYCYRKFSPPAFTEFYRRFARHYRYPEVSDALDLHFAPGPQKTAFHQAAIEQNINRINTEAITPDLREFTDRHPASRYFRGILLSSSLIVVVVGAFINLQPAAMQRLAHVWESYNPPNPYTFSVEPGSVILEQGDSFIPRIQFDDQHPKEVSLAFKTDIEEQYRQRPAASYQEQEAAFTPVSFTSNGSYYFIMDGYRSKEYDISVQLRPRFEQLSLSIVPPEYTELDTVQHSYPFNHIEPYHGSELILEAEANKPLAKAILQHSKGDTVSLQREAQNGIRHEWTATSSDTLSFHLSDSAGLTNSNDFRFIISPTKDTSPTATIIEPGEDLTIQSPENLSVVYEAGDDFGLTSTRLHYEIQRAFSSGSELQSIDLPVPPLNQEQQYEWALPELDLQPRDRLTYWIEVRDNNTYDGPNSGHSQKRVLTFSSMTEYLDDLEARETNVDESLDEISKSFDAMEREYDEFRKQLMQDSEDNWEQQQRLQKVHQQREEVEEQVNKLNERFSKLREEIKNNTSLSPETMQAYNELQQLLKEINNPELADALRKLQESMKQEDAEQLREAMDNYEFNEEMYMERIERTRELFKSLKLNTDLEQLAVALDHLAGLEEKISESDASPAEDLKKQQAVGKDLEELREQLDKLDETSPNQARSRVEELQEESGKQMNQVQQDIEENIQQLREGDQQQKSKQTQQQQRDIHQQMQQMSDNMRQAKQEMSRQQKRVNGVALRYILYSMLNLSVNQEELTRETENLPPGSQAFVDKAREEQNISRQFTRLADSLYKVSAEIPSFSNQINKKRLQVEEQLKRAVEVLSERNKSNATYTQRQSLGGINELTSMVANLLEQLQNQQEGSGGAMSIEQLMEQMQQMSGQQQKLNQQIQNMINDIQGDRLSQDQAERLNQLSRQQNNIRKQMRKLQRNGGLESGDKALSELERMSEDMEDAINEMRGGQLDRQLANRQQNILSRMLNAEDAMQKRGEEEQRRARTAEDTSSATPPDVTLEELQKSVRDMLNDPQRTRFSEDYQRLIEQYFELLREQKMQIERSD